MPLPVVSALAYVLVSAAVALVVGAAINVLFGWAVFALGLGLQLAYHLRHFFLIDAWSRNPSVSTDLAGDGVWDDILARLYRHERDQQLAIQAAQQVASMFDAAGQALIDGLISLDANGRIEWCNRSAETLLGLDREADTGLHIANLVRNPEFVSHLHSGDFSKPLCMRSPIDEERTLSIHVVVYSGAHCLVQFRDITQSDRIDAMRRDFVANVSHELRTPLTVLSGFVETLRDLELDHEERDRYFALMTEQSGRMLRILEELLVLSNLESAPLPPATDRVDMDMLTEKLLRDAGALSGGRHVIRLETSGSGDLLGSEVELASALGNLVSNAIRYTPEGGSITLSWRVNPQGAEFAVEDTGIGIEAKHIPRLTERFYRVDRSRSRETGGTGLGLAIVKHALSRHQATLDVQSTPGKGSRFAACFPLNRVVH